MQALKIAETAQAAAFFAGEDEMVEQAAVERFGRDGKAARFSQVAGAWPRIATWMIVSENEARAVMQRGVTDDLAQGKVDTAGIPFVAGKMDAAAAAVEMSNP